MVLQALGGQAVRVLAEYEMLFSPALFIVGGDQPQGTSGPPLLTNSTPVVPANLRNTAGIVGAAMAAEAGMRPDTPLLTWWLPIKPECFVTMEHVATADRPGVTTQTTMRVAQARGPYAVTGSSPHCDAALCEFERLPVAAPRPPARTSATEEDRGRQGGEHGQRS